MSRVVIKSMPAEKRKREVEADTDNTSNDSMLIDSLPNSLRACVRLSNGVLMPWVGFGTYGLKDATTKSAPAAAVDVGYRLLDTVTLPCADPPS